MLLSHICSNVHMPVMQETWVRSLGREDPLEEGMVTRSSTLACRMPWTVEPGGLQPRVSHRVGHDGVTNTFLSHVVSQPEKLSSEKRVPGLYQGAKAPVTHKISS